MKSEKFNRYEKLENNFKQNGEKLVQFIDDTQNKFSTVKDQVDIGFILSLLKFSVKSMKKI
jgi:hypothetical protein